MAYHTQGIPPSMTTQVDGTATQAQVRAAPDETTLGGTLVGKPEKQTLIAHIWNGHGSIFAVNSDGD